MVLAAAAGNILRNLGQPIEAEVSIRKAIELNPNFAEAYSNLGNILNDQGILTPDTVEWESIE